MMEAIERHAGERYDGPVIDASHYNLRRQHACVDPLEIHIPMGRNYSEHLLLEWVLGFDLLTRRPTYAPLNCVVSPYTTFSGMPLFYSSTNGLASGNTRVDALCHALCEVVERDASALAMASSHVRPAVAAILSDIGFWWGVSPERKEAPLISLRGLPRRAATLVRKLSEPGSRCNFKISPQEPALPRSACTIAEPQGLPIVMNAHSGCGTHPDARIALTRALTEAAQTRLTCIQGGREDLPDLARTSGAAPAETWYNGGHSISFDDIASYQHPTINDDVEFIVERMRQFGFDQVVVPPCAPRRAADCRAPRECRLRGRSASGKFGDPDDRSLYSLVRMQLFRDHDDVPTS